MFYYRAVRKWKTPAISINESKYPGMIIDQIYVTITLTFDYGSVCKHINPWPGLMNSVCLRIAKIREGIGKKRAIVW